MKVVVVGAGVVGSSITYQLAKRGVDVTVVDKGIPGDAASAASLAWTNSNDKAALPEYHRLSVMSIGEWGHVARELGASTWYRRTGNTLVASNPTTAAGLRAHLARSQARGYAAIPIEPRDLPRLDSAIRVKPEYEFAVYFPDEGHILVPQLIQELLTAATSFGSTVRSGTEVSGLIREGDRVTGVVLGDGERLLADTVVLAAGTGISGLLDGQGVTMQTRGRPGVSVVTSPGASRLSSVFHLPDVYLRPDAGGRVHIQSPDGDAAIDEETWTLPEAAVRDQLGRAEAALADVVPGSLRAERIQLAYRPHPFDGLPVIGNWDGIPGLYVSTMHSGVTLGAITGRLVAEEVVSGEESPVLEGFRPARAIAAAAAGTVVDFDPYAVEGRVPSS